MELKHKLMSDAKRKGICIDGFKDMDSKSIPELIDYYMAHPDWCMKHDFPDLQTLSESFGDIEERGVYVGKSFNGETFAKRQAYVFHNCEGIIRVAMDYDNAIIPMLYFANGCRMNVECEQSNYPAIIVPVYVYGDCDVEAHTDGNVRFITYMHKQR